MDDTRGAQLALLLLGGFEAMVGEVLPGLEQEGHPGVRPGHEFALRAIDGGAATASELGRRLAVSKQAAAKTIVALEQLGYVERVEDDRDARRKRLVVTPFGHEMMTRGAALFNEVRQRWGELIGPDQLELLEAELGRLVASSRQKG